MGGGGGLGLGSRSEFLPRSLHSNLQGTLSQETGDLASAVRRDLSELGQNESGLLEDLHQLSKAEVWPTGSFDARIQAYFCLQSNGACEGEEEKKKL